MTHTASLSSTYPKPSLLQPIPQPMTEDKLRAFIDEMWSQ
jgi:hypothetical protein